MNATNRLAVVENKLVVTSGERGKKEGQDRVRRLTDPDHYI